MVGQTGYLGVAQAEPGITHAYGNAGWVMP